MLIAGLGAITAGMAILIAVVVYWSAHGLALITNVLPAVLGTCMVAIGTQNILGGFLLAIVSGNEAEFLQAPALDEPARGRKPVLPVGPVADAATARADRPI
jgi:hypothetical protein